MSTSPKQMLSEIDSLLGNLKASAKQSKKEYDLFEVLTFSLVARSARNIGADVKLVDPEGSKANSYLFRSSPGPLANPSRKFTHAQISIPGVPALEAHNGIWVVGKSSLPHECDCVVLRRDEAEAAREALRAPLWGPILFHAECKHYKDSIPFWQGRNFLGLALDLGWKGSTLVANLKTPNITKLVKFRRKAAALSLKPADPTDREQALKLFQKRFIRYRDTGDV